MNPYDNENSQLLAESEQQNPEMFDTFSVGISNYLNTYGYGETPAP